MKKTLNNKPFIIAITAILFLSIGVKATSLYYSNQVTYSPTNSESTITTVEEALNELYNKSSNQFNFELVNKVERMRATNTNYTKSSLTLEKGNYLIVAASRATEYGANFSVEGCDELEEVGAIYYSDFDITYAEYYNGRGGGTSKLYKCNLDSEKEVTFGCANAGGNFIAYCGYGIFR